ncbi:T9SS type A sorting domain-containing protein [Cryomorpha ignava]|uniref:receptor protein-tyrosine kinase n=1 Tax=Cryomorpha ignava TaxID=101383 RepID=A0A7K3WNG7_9FLAO|nr:glycine-rich protein [Cryomorpha ignava]NEN23197.1 T9SS type A sorting domain-containing protein [Cryomorpha ignava]
MNQKFTLKQKWRGAKIVSLVTLFCSLFVFDAISQQVWDFDYTGSAQSLELPAGPFLLEVWGAEGGNGSLAASGGKGGYSVGEFTLSESQTVQIFVGEAGQTTGSGSFNGGGAAGTNYGAEGGGATDVRLSPYAFINRIIVAGGGGGASYGSTPSAGGAGGGLTGLDGSNGNSFTGGKGGTQSAGGQAGCCYGNASPGTFGLGASPGDFHNAGGGGGWYGGGSGAAHSGAGGGSGYTAGLIEAAMIAGNATMPNPTGGDMNGKIGNGFARITQLYSVAVQSLSDASCAETADGSLSVSINGGTPPYTFVWSNGVTTTSGNAISGYTLLGNIGEHSYYRSDAQSGTYDEAQADAESNLGYVASITSAEENAWLMANGVQGGDNIGGSDTAEEGTWVWASGEPFSYSNWSPGEPNNGNIQNNMQMYPDGKWDNVVWAGGPNVRHIMELPGVSKIENLAPGEYTVTVTDANGTETTGTYTVGPDPIEIIFAMTPSSTCDEAGDGALEAQVSGGTAPYSYVWSSGETNALISNKAIGEYTVTVTDANNCASVEATGTITPDDSTDPIVLVKAATIYLDENGDAQVAIEDVNDGSYDDCSLELSLGQTDYNCSHLIPEPASFDGITALTLDGTDDYLTFNSVVPQSPSHTMAAWIKTSTINRSVFGWGGAGVNNYSGMAFQGGNIRYYAGNGTAPIQFVTGSTWVTDGNWHHVAISRSNTGEVKIFVDGNLDASGTVSKYINTVTNSSAGAIFANGSFQLAFDGDIDEFATWPTVLSEEAIAELVCNGPLNPDVYLKFEDGTGSSIATDRSENENHANLVNMDSNESWVDFGDPVITPNCASEITTMLIGIDLSGNMNSARAVLTVLDTIAPVAIAKSQTIYLNGDGEAVLNPADLDNGSTDNCAVESFTASKTLFNCSDLGMNSVVLSASDMSGNSGSAATQVEVLDNTAPTVVVENIDVFLNEDGEAFIVPADVEVSASDNCQIASRVLNLSAFTCADLGQEIEIILTVTDNSGNETQESALISVVESIAPVAVAQGYTIELDENGEADLTSAEVAQFIGSGSSDNCGLDADSHALNQMTFSCEDLGANSLTYSVADASGNSDDAPVTITVVDGIAPVAVAQDLIAELNADGIAVISADDADNGSTDNCSIASRALNTSEFSCENLGEQEVTLTVTDASGNESQAVFTVDVVDQVAPTIPELITMNIYLDENGAAIFDTAPLLAEASDNCGLDAILANGLDEEYIDIDGFPIDCEEVGTNQGLLYVRDTSGNLTEFVLELTVIDTIKPSFNLDFIEIELDVEGNAYLTEAMLMPYASDNCSIAEVAIQIEQFDCSQMGAMQFTEILVYDIHGNAKQHTLEVQVIDVMVPQVQVGNITIELNENGQADLSVDILEMMAEDNCAPTNFVLSQTVFSCADLGSNTLSITVADAAGNTGVAEFMVTVVDNVAPEVVAPQTIKLCEGVPVSYDEIVATDNCSAELSLIDGPQAGDTPEVGDYMVEFEAVDPSGNATSTFVMLAVSPTPVVDLGEDMMVGEGTIVTLVAGESATNEYLWSNGGTGIVYQLVAIEDVTVSVAVTTPEGCSSTDEISISIIDPLGIDDDAAGNSVRFYPNPTRGQMSIALSLTEVATDVQMNITDITGKSVAQRMIQTAKDGDVISLDLSGYAKGIYLVNLKSDSFNLTERVVKQ